MLSKSKTISVNGSSKVEIEGKETVIMTMNASINENGSMNMNQYIQDRDAYLENKDTCDSDYAEFKKYAEGFLGV